MNRLYGSPGISNGPLPKRVGPGGMLGFLTSLSGPKTNILKDGITTMAAASNSTSSEALNIVDVGADLQHKAC